MRYTLLLILCFVIFNHNLCETYKAYVNTTGVDDASKLKVSGGRQIQQTYIDQLAQANESPKSFEADNKDAKKTVCLALLKGTDKKSCVILDENSNVIEIYKPQ